MNARHNGRRHTMAAAVLLVVLNLLAGRRAPGEPASDPEGRDDAWRVAVAAVNDGLYKVAVHELEALIAEVAGLPAEAGRLAEAVALLGEAQLALVQPQALLDYLRAQRRWMRRQLPDAYAFWTGMGLYETGQARAAIEAVRPLLRADGEGAYAARALRLSAWCRLALGETNAALQVFEAFDNAPGAREEAAQNRLEWGKVLLTVGRDLDAEAVLAPLLSSQAVTRAGAEATYWTGSIRVQAGNWEAAHPLLASLTATNVLPATLRARAWRLLAAARLGLGDPSGAAQAIRQEAALALDAADVLDATRRLGLLYVSMDRLDEGISLLLQFVTSVPDNPLAGEAQLVAAGALLDHGRMEDALDAYQHYLESFSDPAGLAAAHRGRGAALHALGRYAEAAAAFEKALPLLAKDERAACLHAAGDAYFANQQYGQAASTYARLVEEYPDGPLVPSALYHWGECLAMHEAFDEAETTFQRLVARYPEDPFAEEALYRIAERREHRGLYVAAAEAYTALVNAWSNGTFAADALVGRGRARYRLFRFSEALEDFTRVVETTGEGPQVEAARYQIIMCYFLLGQGEEASRLAVDFLVRYPESAFASRVLFWQARQAFNEERYADAERDFGIFLQRYPKDPDAESAVLWAGRAAARRQEYLGAIEHFTTLIKEFPQGARLAEARLEQGNALSALAKFSEAILVYQELVTRYPESDAVAETWLRIGDCQFMLGQDDSARYTSAMQAYRAAINSPHDGLGLDLQAEYKIGRCLQKLERPEEAIHQFYKRVMLRFLEAGEKGQPQTEAARMWFGLASRDAADILEQSGEWRKLVSILERAVDAGVPGEAGFRERIRNIRSQHWWLFY